LLLTLGQKYKKMKKFLFIALIFNLTLACNHAPKLKLTSFIRYIAPEEAIQADVSIFNEKNPTTSIKVDKLFFNGGAMEKKENKIQGIVYRSERDGKYPTDFAYTFNFEKNDYQASVKASPIKDLVIVDSLAHKKNGINSRYYTKQRSFDSWRYVFWFENGKRFCFCRQKKNGIY
jgi:hypothetical protein